MFEFIWPWVFLLAPLPWLLRFWLPPVSTQQQALRVPFLQDLQMLSAAHKSAPLTRIRQHVVPILIWVLLLLAAARPEWLGPPLPLPSSGRDLLFAVDVSGSMSYADMSWKGEKISRLDLVKRLMGPFILGREGDRVGLILFGSQAYLQAPLTFDRLTVRTWLDEALIGIAGKNTAIGDAIGLAVKRLRERPAQSRVLILMTDGANTAGQIEPLTAAHLAAEEHVKIYPIGIGADPKAQGITGLLGLNPGVDLNEAELTQIAQATGGQYFRARTALELREISETLDHLEPVVQAPKQVHLSQPLFAWPLGLALLLSMLGVAYRLWPERWHSWSMRIQKVWRRTA